MLYLLDCSKPEVKAIFLDEETPGNLIEFVYYHIISLSRSLSLLNTLHCVFYKNHEPEIVEKLRIT